MSFRIDWLSRIRRALRTASPRTRRTMTHQRLEALECRRYLSAAAVLAGDGHTLRIVGDEANDQVAVVMNGDVVTVTCNSDAPKQFGKVDTIQVDLGKGNDTFTFDGQLPPGPCRLLVDAGDGDDTVQVDYVGDTSGRDTIAPSFDAEIQLGAGNDHFSSDILLPPGPCNVMVDGGDGDDTISQTYRNNAHQTGGLPPGPCDVLLNGDAGSDTIDVQYKIQSTDLGGLPPGPCNVQINAGIGDDKISFGYQIDGTSDSFSNPGGLPPGPCNVLVDAGDGNDAVGFALTGDNVQHSAGGGGGAGFVMNFAAKLGTGDDSFTGNVQLPPGPCNVMVDGGDGNDVVNLGSLLNHDTGDFNFTMDLGTGNDQFQGNLLFEPGAFTPSDKALPPGPCRWTVTGDAGVDSIYALIGLLSNASPTSDVQAPIVLLFDGGDGADVVRATVRNVNLNNATSINLLGGTGNDIVIQSFDNVSVDAGLDFYASGGIGDDLITVGAVGDSSSGYSPRLFVNSETHIAVDAGAGNDRIYGLLTPRVKSTASLNLSFSGGDGNDTFNLTIGLEPASSDPRSGQITLEALGGTGDDLLNFTVQNLGASASPFAVRLSGGDGNDTAKVTSGIDASGWTN